jgi:serine protease Do
MMKKMLSRRNTKMGVFAMILIGALAFFAVGAIRNVSSAEKSHFPPPIPESKIAGLESLQNGFTAIAQRIEPSVVMIKVEKKVQAVDMSPGIDNIFPNFPDFGFPGFPQTPQTYLQQAAGSGVVIRSDGWILTNDHVVSNATKVTVYFQDGRQMEGTVRRDFRSDIAVIHVNANDLTPAEFANSDDLKVGQWAAAFGAPYELSNTMTLGIVSALHRQTAIQEGPVGRFYPSLIQTDAAINPGNSGGPLVDIHGRVIGINVAINSPNGGSVGIGFAIPSNRAIAIANDLINNGKVVRGYLGVAPVALTPLQRQQFGVPEGGALIAQVSDNTPASRAGLQVEDVVLKIDGKPVKNDVALRDIIARTPPGTRISLLVRRNGKDIMLYATLGKLPEELATGEPVASENPNKLGLKVETITPQVAQSYNLSNVSSGVVVTAVQSGSPADLVGIQPGDVITRINQEYIHNKSQYDAAVSNLKSGDNVTLVVKRADMTMMVTTQLP